MYRLTTPTVSFTFPEDVDMTLADEVYVTFTDTKNNILLEKKGSDLDVAATSVSLFLSQEDTIDFPTKGIRVQINWTYTDEGVLKRACTDILSIAVSENLHPTVITGE